MYVLAFYEEDVTAMILFPIFFSPTLKFDICGES